MENSMIKLTAKHFDSVTKKDRCSFPLNSKPILNIATQNSQATRPAIVGSMKEFWTKFLATGNKTVEQWEQWYIAHTDSNGKNGNDRIQAATDKLYAYLNKMPLDHNVFTRDIAEKYILDLIVNKTHYGMSGEYHSVVAVANYFKKEYRFSTPEEESQGIDAWIGECPVQVKPEGTVVKHHVRNHADTEKTLVITYKSKEDVCFIHNPEFVTQ